MAYVNELEQTISCVITNAMRFNNLVSNWLYVIVPLLFFIGLYFVIAHYAKNNKVLISYAIIVSLIWISWILLLWFDLRCA